MKNLLTLISFILFINLQGLAQTDGLNYQAVIIDPNPEEIPGIDVVGNILPNKEINIRTIEKKLDKTFQMVSTFIKLLLKTLIIRLIT